MDALTSWDWLVVVVALLSIVIGFVRGLVRTVFALAAWIAGLVAAPTVSPMVIDATGMQQHPWVVYLLVFIAVFVAVRLFGGLVVRLLKRAGLRGADRMMGGLLGAARALLVIAVAAIAATVAGLSDSAAWRDARCRPLLDGIVQWAQPYLPEKLSGIRRT